MKVFFGAAIQGHRQTDEWSHVDRLIPSAISDLGHETYAEHTRGETTEEIIALTNRAIGYLSENPEERVSSALWSCASRSIPPKWRRSGSSGTSCVQFRKRVVFVGG